jgi:hypothetical protein
VENEETKPIGNVIVREHELKCSKRNRAVESTSIRRSLLHHVSIDIFDFDREEEATVRVILLWDIPIKLDVLQGRWWIVKTRKVRFQLLCSIDPVAHLLVPKDKLNAVKPPWSAVSPGFPDNLHARIDTRVQDECHTGIGCPFSARGGYRCEVRLGAELFAQTDDGVVWRQFYARGTQHLGDALRWELPNLIGYFLAHLLFELMLNNFR